MYYFTWTLLNNSELGTVVIFNAFSVEKMSFVQGHTTGILFSMLIPIVSLEICKLFFLPIYIYSTKDRICMTFLGFLS